MEAILAIRHLFLLTLVTLQRLPIYVYYTNLWYVHVISELGYAGIRVSTEIACMTGRSLVGNLNVGYVALVNGPHYAAHASIVALRIP
ncbi:hypothetical protein F4777DRAFT_526137 [Nemania sp. FL0916]|nr:hypothetical protein F4777DRAFT_526137 [Nemania sp. FL0916]